MTLVERLSRLVYQRYSTPLSCNMQRAMDREIDRILTELLKESD